MPPDFQRIAKTLHHEEPDRVPLVEAVVDFSIMSRFLGRKVADEDLALQVEFWRRAGYDFIPLTVGMMRPGRVTMDSQISQVIRAALMRKAEQDGSWDLLKEPRLHTEADFETFPWELAANLDFSKFVQVQRYLPEGMKIIALSGKIFTLTWMLMGFENFALNLTSNPDFVGRVVEKVARIQLDGVRQVARIPNVAAVWAVDDLAFNLGPLISPHDLRQYIFPWYEEFGRCCHDHRLYFFFHSDGVIWDLAEDLIALGVDALHPLDPTCMDIEEAKQKLGDRITLIGNISTELLECGTPQEVAELTKRRLRMLAPGGGYCLGSGNSVPDWARIENYRAMVETGLAFGRYPIQIG